MTEGRVVAVCRSDRKGIPKDDIGTGVFVKGLGLDGDAHAGFAHRQVSLIAMEDIQIARAKLPSLRPGSFAENLTVEGIDLEASKVGLRLKVGDVLLEVSQIGKECHTKWRNLQDHGRLHHAEERHFLPCPRRGKGFCRGQDRMVLRPGVALRSTVNFEGEGKPSPSCCTIGSVERRRGGGKMVHEHVTAVRVRYAETDAMGVAYHSNYLVWFRIGPDGILPGGRISLQAMGGNRGLSPGGRGKVSLQHPARYDDLLEIHAEISELKPYT